MKKFIFIGVPDMTFGVFTHMGTYFLRHASKEVSYYKGSAFLPQHII